jgi:fructoselysine-6-P-deglycase FrlB-like protein
MAHDMERQLVDLPAMPLPEPASGRVVLAGSGDSYAAALAAQYLSSGRVICCQPADIVSDPKMVNGASAYFVSVSGRTRANVLAAESARRAGARTVAVTGDISSPLAAACGNMFELKFKSAGKTSGTIGFTASLLACCRIAANASCPADLKTIYKDAARKAKRIVGDIKTKNIVILGDSMFYPAAIYGALKFSEVFGSKAAAYHLEDYCHAPLFGHRDDQVIVFGIKNDIDISRRLKRAGMSVQYVDCGKYDRLGAVLFASFFMQHLTLGIAMKKKMKECYFLRNRKLLDTSSDIIY